MNIQQQQRKQDTAIEKENENGHWIVMIKWCNNVNYNFQPPATASKLFVVLSFYLFIHLTTVGH